MGDTIKPEVTGKQLRSLNRYLPDLLQTLGDNTGPYNQAMINARALTDPQQLALDQSLLSYFGPQFNEIGSNLQRQNAMNQSKNELSVLLGPGAATAQAGMALNQMADPEYFAVRRAGADKLGGLLASQSPDSLTGSETANIERGASRMNIQNGLHGTPSQTNTISNAMMFGNELDKKRNTLLNTINAVPQNLASMKSGFDAFQVATGRPSYGPNQGMGQYSTSRNGFGQDVAGIGQGLLGEIGQNKRQSQQLDAQKRDGLDRAMQVTQGVSSLMGSAGGGMS